ncbi:hypothetical protein [Deinococcus humi]|uniref:Uncharacterized protein n=1 Tax=Deinococcus humi TaxID=662880 RepID=A0A7W8JQU0_9DEIO|nr:hypothetical protein [Deinococcus humi]MBB5361527.1 hypothetical protein [Deinococcus humi]GGO20528.1 hypothetical protein GCM10008949_05870 [Deinococcus humi]
MTDNRYGDKPLGKSVEEVESEQGNRVNSPVSGETRRNLEADAAIVPAVVGGGNQSTGAVLALTDPDVLTEAGSGADDRRNSAEQPMSGWADEDQVNMPMPDRDRGTSES